MINPSLIKSVKELHAKRTGSVYWRYTFPEWSTGQLGFLESNAKKLLVRGPRRAGKTQALAERMLKKVNTPVTIPTGEEVHGAYVYITQTRELAKSIMWKELKEMCKKRGLSYASNEVDLRMVFPNGGSIELQGAGLQDSANKARGRKMVGVAVDEAAFIAPLREIIQIWSATLADYEGEMVLSCSPGKSPTGYFYECDQGQNKEHWDRYYLNPAENPAFKGGKYEAFRNEQLKTLYGGNENHPVYRREWLGEWIHDSGNLLIKFDPKKNVTEEEHTINHDLFDYYIGLDLGFLDSTALSVAAVHKFEPWMEYVDEFTQTEMRIEAILKKVKEYSDVYDPETVIVDSGGFGKHTMEELRAREDFPAAIPAYKYNKKLNIEMLNNDLAANRVFVNKKCHKLREAWTKVLKTQSGKEDDAVDYGNKYVLDILDSSLYVHTESHPKVVDKIDTPETAEERMKRKHLEKHQKMDKILDRYGAKGIFK
jgi:hypothetical protein